MRKHPLLKKRARQLRRQSTPAETIVWQMLRGRRFAGFKFRRQQPVGTYIVDFFCADLSLVIELDGETHVGREKNDESRQKWLEEQEFTVLRFWNPEVYEDREMIEDTIWRECERVMQSRAPSPPAPLPRRGEGERGARQHRPGFTLVEMLVATALIMFIMLILSEAFAHGIDAFRLLKGIGDMEAKMRAAVTTMSADLKADHFESRRRLSDPSFASQGDAYLGWAPSFGFYHPREGFVSIVQGATPTTSLGGVAGGGALQTVNVPGLIVNNVVTGMFWQIQPGAVLLVDAGSPTQETVLVQTTPSFNSFTAVFVNPHPNPFSIRLIRYLEGQDPDGLVSSRAVDHQLNFTVKLRGNRREDFFSANVGSGSPLPLLASATTLGGQSADANFQDTSTEYSSPWAEVAYFLVPTGTNANGTPLYALYRSQFVLMPNTLSLPMALFGITIPLNPADPNDPVVPGFAYGEMSCQNASGNVPPINGDVLGFNNPNDVSTVFTPLTYSSTPVAGPGNAQITPLSMNGCGYQIVPGMQLVVDWGTPNQETIQVIGVTANSFTANFASPNGHAAGFAIQSVRRAFPTCLAGRRNIFFPNQANLWGATLLLTDVVSFDVKVFDLNAAPQAGDFLDLAFVPLSPITPAPGAYDTGGAPVYDALGLPHLPAVPLKAIQITLRVWNFKTQQTRQITMIQDL